MPLIQIAIRQIITSIIGLLALVTSDPSVPIQNIETTNPIQVSVIEEGGIQIAPPQILWPEFTKSLPTLSPTKTQQTKNTGEVLDTSNAQEKLDLLRDDIKDLEIQITALKERMSKLPPVSNSIPVIVAVPSIQEDITDDYIEIETEEVDVEEEEIKVSHSPADSVVHIACLQEKGNLTNLVTGSGVIIDSSGIVLTNAHVGFLFLLEDYDCAINKENLPIGFKAEVVYLPLEWARKNRDILSEDMPKGTGEYDFAILMITEGTNSAVQLPKDFIEADLFLDSDSLEKGKSVLVIGYPGLNTGNLTRDALGSINQEYTEIDNIFTFDHDTLDIFSTDLISIARQGISGGGIFNDSGSLIGLITTITDPSGSYGAVNALSLGYINRQIEDLTDKDLNYFASESVSDYLDIFSPSLEEIRDIIE